MKFGTQVSVTHHLGFTYVARFDQMSAISAVLDPDTTHLLSLVNQNLAEHWPVNLLHITVSPLQCLVQGDGANCMHRTKFVGLEWI